MHISAIILSILLTAHLQAQDHQIKVISLNVRFDNPADGKNAWEYRRINITKGSQLYYDMLERFREYNDLQNTELISAEPVVGAESTYNAFRHDTEPRVIDYIFADSHFDVISYGVDNVIRDGVFISDHWPVKAVLVLGD